MTRKLTQEEARAVMLAANLQPLEPYDNRNSPWKCKCLSCGKVVTPSFGAVRNNGGGCKPCGMARSICERNKRNSFEAIKVLKSFNVKPIVDYPGPSKQWHCFCNKCKHDIFPMYGNIRNGSNPCAYCSGKKTHPDDALKIMKKAGLRTLIPYPGYRKPWKSIHVKCGRTVSPTLNTIFQGGKGCITCGYESTREKQMIDPLKAKKFFLSKGFLPLEPYPGAKFPWKSKCKKCGYVVSPRYGSVKSGSGCGICAGKIVEPTVALKIMNDSKLKPLGKYPGQKVPWKSKCMRCGKTVSPKYSDIRAGDGGCKYCGGHYVDPVVVVKTMKSRGLYPLEPYTDSGTKWKCQCKKCGRQIFPRWDQIRNGQSGCAYCAHRKVDPLVAVKEMKKNGAIPLVPYPGANAPWECTCKKCKRFITPSYSAVVNTKQSPCIYCSGGKVDELEAYSLMIAGDVTPLVQYPGADKPWLCRCNKCGKEITPRYTSLRVGQGGCKYCAEKGLHYNEPAFLYLMEHKKLKAFKLGIGNHKTRNNRIVEHKKQGWVLLNQIDFATGDDAFQVEQRALKWVRDDMKLLPGVARGKMPQRGWTETFPSKDLPLETIWAEVLKRSKVKR